jgi:mevalonate kinase
LLGNSVESDKIPYATHKLCTKIVSKASSRCDKIPFVYDTARQLHFTRSLERFSSKLDELLNNARRQSPLTPELIDEIAFTTGELMLVLTNYPSHQDEVSVREALAHAKSLRERLRIEQPESDQVAKECDSFNQEIAQLVLSSKKAA